MFSGTSSCWARPCCGATRAAEAEVAAPAPRASPARAAASRRSASPEAARPGSPAEAARGRRPRRLLGRRRLLRLRGGRRLLRRLLGRRGLLLLHLLARRGRRRVVGDVLGDGRPGRRVLRVRLRRHLARPRLVRAPLRSMSEGSSGFPHGGSLRFSSSAIPSSPRLYSPPVTLRSVLVGLIPRRSVCQPCRRRGRARCSRPSTSPSPSPPRPDRPTPCSRNSSRRARPPSPSSSP